MDQLGIETGFEWNSSEISASTSVFDISGSLSGDHNYSVMSELAFRGPENTSPREYSNTNIKYEETTISQAVPSEESMVADAMAAWGYDQLVTLTKNGRKRDEKVLNSKQKKKVSRKIHGSSNSLELSAISEISENSINCSTINSAILLPKINELFPKQFENNCEYPNSIDCSNNVNLISPLSTESSAIPCNNESLQQSNKGGAAENQLSKSKLNYSEKKVTIHPEIGSTNSSFIDSSDICDSSSKKGDGVDSEISNNSTLLLDGNGSIQEAKATKNKPKKKPTTGAVTKRAERKTKSKGTQVNIKKKATDKNTKQKKQKTEGKKQAITQGKKETNKQEKVQKNNKPKNKDGFAEGNNPVIESNNLNITMNHLPGSEIELKKRERLLEEKVVNFLEMPTTSHSVFDMNSTYGCSDTMSENLNNSIVTSVTPEHGSQAKETPCAIQIARDEKNAQKISIVLPPEITVSVSKKKVAAMKNTSTLKKINKVKQEKSFPKRRDSTTLSGKSGKIKHKKIDKKKETVKHSTRDNLKIDSNRSNKINVKRNPEPKVERKPQTITLVSKKNVAAIKNTSTLKKKNKVKQEQSFPIRRDSTALSGKPGKIKHKKMDKKKKTVKHSTRDNLKIDSNRSNKINVKRNPEPKVERKQQTITCGYMSSDSSEESEESGSHCCSEGSSDTCSCSDCTGSYSSCCSYCNGNTSCSCSDCCSESSYESPYRKRHHR